MGMENPNKEIRGLDERFEAYPKISERLRRIADELERTLEEGGSLSEAEDRVVPMIRELGQEVMEARAHRVEAQVPRPSGSQVHRHSKKKSAG